MKPAGGGVMTALVSCSPGGWAAPVAGSAAPLCAGLQLCEPSRGFGWSCCTGLQCGARAAEGLELFNSGMMLVALWQGDGIIVRSWLVWRCGVTDIVHSPRPVGGNSFWHIHVDMELLASCCWCCRCHDAFMLLP
jgi:hypothetical protein